MEGHIAADIQTLTLKDIADSGAGQVGTVVFLAQMSQEDMGMGFARQAGQRPGRIHVGQMPPIAHDAFFQVPGIGSLTQHINIMVGFQH